MLPKLPILAKDAGIYGAFRLSRSTVSSLLAWSQDNLVADGIETIKPDELHVTTVYCRKPIPTKPVGDFRVSADFARFEVFGPPDKPGTLVAVLSCEALTNLFNARRKLGAEWDFPEYIPHVSLAKNFDPKDVADLAPITFPIILTQEYFNELDEDFSYDTKETKASESDAFWSEAIVAASMVEGKFTHAHLCIANEGRTASVRLPHPSPPPLDMGAFNQQIMEAIGQYFDKYAPETITVYQEMADSTGPSIFNPANSAFVDFIRHSFGYEELPRETGASFEIALIDKPRMLTPTVWLLRRVPVHSTIAAIRGLTDKERDALVSDLKHLPFKVRVLKASRGFVNIRAPWKNDEEQVKWSHDEIKALNSVLDRNMLTSVATTDSASFAENYERKHNGIRGYAQHGYDNVGVKIMRTLSTRKPIETTARGESFQAVYHFTNPQNAAKILAENKIGLTVDIGNNIEKSFRGGKGKVYYLSTTRSTLGEYSRKGVNGNYPGVHFVLDKNRLNQRYAIKPIDYWDQQWVKRRAADGGGDSYYSREMEDRVYSSQAFIPVLPFTRAIHLFLPEKMNPFVPEPDSYPGDNEEMKARRFEAAQKEVERNRKNWSEIRKLILLAARIKMPFFIFTDIKAFLAQNFRKAKKPSEVPFLMAKVKPEDDTKPYVRRHRDDDMVEFRELVYKKSIDELSKEGKKRLSSMFSYKDDFIRGLEADLHNSRVHDRVAAAKMERAMRSVMVHDVPSFYQKMYDKWRPIQDLHDRDYNRKWHADYEKKNYSKIWDNYDPAFPNSPAFIEKARKEIAKLARPMIESWPEGENKRYIQNDLAKAALPVLRGIPGIVDAYAGYDRDRDDMDHMRLYVMDEPGNNFVLFLESRKYIHSMGHIMDPVAVYPEHVLAAKLPGNSETFAQEKEGARYT